VRLGLTALLWLVALWSVVRPAARRRLGAAAVVLAGAPFPVLALNSYGGEALLRVYLYSLPFMAVLVANSLYRPGWRASRTRPAVVGAGLMALLMAFPVARYGNERFEMVRPGEAAAVRWTYAHAPSGSTIYAVSGSLPWRYRDLEDHQYESALPYLRDLDATGLANAMALQPGGAVLVLTRGQLFDLEDNEGLTDTWAGRVGARLAFSPRLRVLYSNDDALVVAPLPVGPTVRRQRLFGPQLPVATTIGPATA